MSAIETILFRMMSDPAFADALFTNAEKALAEYGLSAEDLGRFKGLTRARFEALTENPEERKSFGIIVDEKRGGWDGNHNQSALKIAGEA